MGHSSFGKYISQLSELHKLIHKGLGDSEEANKLRDAMDLSWWDLDEEEVDLANEVSAIMYGASDIIEDLPEESVAILTTSKNQYVRELAQRKLKND